MNFIQLSIKRPIFIFMIALFLAVIGSLALRVLPVDLYPNVTFPVLQVEARLEGAAPEEIEQLITKPMEEALSALAGLTTLRSSSREGVSVISMEFSEGTDIKFQEMDVRAKMSNIRTQLPVDMKEPAVYRHDPDEVPIIEIAATGNRSASELSELAQYVIAKRLRQVDGVGAVDLSGDRQPEIWVKLDPLALENWQLNASEIVARIKAFTGNSPVGKVEGKDKLWLVRSISPIKTTDDLRYVPVGKTPQGTAILLQDVATLTPSFERLARISRFNHDGKLERAVLLSVTKQSGQNTVAVSNAVLLSLEKIKAELPRDVTMTVTQDSADLVRSNIVDVVESLAMGALLTVLVVLLFLRSPRATFTTGISLPSSVITTFAIMVIAGFTVNTMTLLALSLAIGLLVDDAIVVRENIFRHLKVSLPKKAAYDGTREVSLAVLATTLCIVAVFLPVAFMGGVSGQFFKQFALTVVFAVLVSLWDALTMAPMLSAYFANVADPSLEWKGLGRLGRWINHRLERFEQIFERFEGAYASMLRWLLPRPWVATCGAALALLIALAGFIFVGKGFLPSQLGTVFSAQLSGPIGIPVDKVIATSNEVNERVRAVKGLKHWTITAGLSGTGSANIRLTLNVDEKYARNQLMLAGVRNDVRKALAGLIGYVPRIGEPSDPLAGSSGKFQPIAVNVSGDDITTLRSLARTVQELMTDVRGIVDVAPLPEEGVPEYRIVADPKFSGYFGLSTHALANEMSIWVGGDTHNYLEVANQRVPIRVSLQGGESLTSREIMAKKIFARSPQTGKTVGYPLSRFANFDTAAGSGVIVRENRDRIVRIGANIQREIPLGTIISDLQAKLDSRPLPAGYRMRIIGQSEHMAELFWNIIIALLLGCLFMYMILASLFESFIHPLTVMAAIPLAGTGAVLALLLFGFSLDLYSGIGMILLAGIVAKNSILLVDFASQRVRERNIAALPAILESAPLRLRPILMTSIAMIVGMLPVALGIGSGGAARMGLGIATIGGILSSTVLTLLVVPSLFVAVENGKTYFMKRKEGF